MYDKRIRNDERPTFPKRAVVTGGMPYGNKALHFGHIGGVFIQADVFARFLKDRIGKDNVIFVSGTDCYGSPILEGYRKAQAEGHEGTMEDYVNGNHLNQKKTLEDYQVGLSLFGASAFGAAREVHEETSAEIFKTLYRNGRVVKMTTPQFYDEENGVFLNGRQVTGRCPVEGCTSEKAYADECSLGHQYMPSELLEPVSELSGKKPTFRDVTNWYFQLDDYREAMTEYVDSLRRNTNTRKYQLNVVQEFLKKPFIYVQRKYIDDLAALEASFPEHETVDEEKKPSITFIFENLCDRDEGKRVLDEKGVHYRAGKTLVPFRLSGNTEWGVKVPELDGEKNLTFWVWPESLWAPISFVKTYLKEKGHSAEEWVQWWDSEDSAVYQFIGEDNVYFYAIAEMGLLAALKSAKSENPNMQSLHLPHIIANRHVLFMDVKASSSSTVKPPMADELLTHYTAEQLRMHFLSLGLSSKSASFRPQPYMAEEERQGVDVVLKEGNLLTNVYNRLVRSCFYSIQKYTDGRIPSNDVTEKMLDVTRQKVYEYERHMYNHEFHRIAYVLDEYVREWNKYWVNNSKTADQNDDDALRRQILADCFYGVKVGAILLHPIAPAGCEMVGEYLNIGEELWNWDSILEPLSHYVGPLEEHEVLFLEPKVDFFKKHPSQYE